MQVSHILTVCHLINLIFVVLLAYLALLILQSPFIAKKSIYISQPQHWQIQKSQRNAVLSLELWHIIPGMVLIKF